MLDAGHRCSSAPRAGGPGRIGDPGTAGARPAGRHRGRDAPGPARPRPHGAPPARGLPFIAWRGRPGSPRRPRARPGHPRGAADRRGDVDRGPFDLLEVELLPGGGRVGDLVAHAWHLGPGVPTPCGPCGPTRRGRRWSPPASTRTGRWSGRPGWSGSTGLAGGARTCISPCGSWSRGLLGTGGAPVAAGPRLRNPDPRARLRPLADAARTPAGPDVPRRWTERPARGVARLARPRRSTPSAGSVLERGTRGRGGPPAARRHRTGLARYLDPADPHLLRRTEPGRRRRCRAAGRVDLAGRAAHPGPQVEPGGEFRVLLRRGDPNLLHGDVVGARPGAGCEPPGHRPRLARGRRRPGRGTTARRRGELRDRQRHRARHLDRGPEPRRPHPPADRGPFTISLSETGGLRTDLGRSLAFGSSRTHPAGGADLRAAARSRPYATRP